MAPDGAGPLGQQACEGADGVSGTVAYLSPEQAVGQPATPASDGYGLGVVAYECLAGRRPFTADDPIAVAVAHLLQTPPPLPADIPVPVRTVVARAMAKRPGSRPADAALFGRQLLALREALSASDLDAA